MQPYVPAAAASMMAAEAGGSSGEAGGGSSGSSADSNPRGAFIVRLAAGDPQVYLRKEVCDLNDKCETCSTYFSVNVCVWEV